MEWPAFPCLTLSPGEAGEVLARLAAGRQLWSPQPGGDGVCRLRPCSLPAAAAAPLPLISLKKLVFPARDPLWHWGHEGYAAPGAPPPGMAVGVALCDLQALDWLDRAFADDEIYLARRRRLLVVGGDCVPDDGCACQPEGLPPGGDLFCTEDRLWVLSPAGADALREAGMEFDAASVPLPGPNRGVTVTAVGEARFLASAGLPLWEQEAARCLACGACSAVCPTCCCYEVIDEAALDGTVTRQRVWDNCFFPDHARVAGGYDFRAGRGRRLRFRFEHKRLGFGPLRGVSSCVGCGRCRRACPVGIDLEPVARRLAAEGGE